jgi:hypothetical protein
LSDMRTSGTFFFDAVSTEDSTLVIQVRNGEYDVQILQ